MKSVCKYLVVFLLLATNANADQPRSSDLKVWEENDQIILLHTHSVRAWSIAHSEMRLLNKTDGKLISQFDSAPITQLFAIPESNLFVGISDLLAAAQKHGYNFILFDDAGRILSKVMIQPGSPYCKKVYASVSQSVEWFDSAYPNPTLMKEDGVVLGVRINGISFDDSVNYCELPLGDFSDKWRS